MNDLENELRNALRRQYPPPGFSERVVRRAAETREPAGTARPWVIRWAAAAMLAAALGGTAEYRRIQTVREERARGEAAKEQVMQALRIAGSKLHMVQITVKEIGS
jgi:hypothetical protein